MKQIFTLFALMASMTLFAQNVNETFESQANFDALSSNCWTFTNVTFNDQNPISGTGDIISAWNTRSEISTPFLQLPFSITISFSYKVVQEGTGVDKVQIHTENTNGVRTRIAKTDFTGSGTYSRSFNNQTGIKKIIIEINNTTLEIDNLTISAPNYYQGGGCNRAPLAVNDEYNAPFYAPYNGSSVLANDSEPDGESMTLELVTPSADGSVVLNANGTFTFTPNPEFTGASTTFQYRLTDNGYSPASAIATVTINFPASAGIPMPVKLTSFSGNLNNNKVLLKWSVEDNETGKYFQVQSSADGKNFANAGMIFTTAKVGSENYQFEETLPYAEGAYYRIQIVNKDNSIAYSKVIALKGQASAADYKITVLQNPIKGNSIQFTLTSSTNEANTVSVYNMAGVQVYAKQVPVQKGLNTISITLNNELSAGTYILETRTASTRNVTRIIK